MNGQMLTVGRAPGDFITTSVLGETAASGIPRSSNRACRPGGARQPGFRCGRPDPRRPDRDRDRHACPDVMQNAFTDHRMPVALMVYPAGTRSGCPGHATPIATATPAADAVPARAHRHHRRESPARPAVLPLPGTPARQRQRADVCIRHHLAVSPIRQRDRPGCADQPVEIKPGLMVNPATLLAALDQNTASCTWRIEPAGGLQTGEILTLNLGEMYQALNKDTLISDPAAVVPTATATIAPTASPWPQMSLHERTLPSCWPAQDTKLVIYQMQPAFLSDPRFTIAGYAQSWESLQGTLTQLKPDILVIQADVAPGPDALLKAAGRYAGLERGGDGDPAQAAGHVQGRLYRVDERCGARVFVMPRSTGRISPGLAYGAGHDRPRQVVSAVLQRTPSSTRLPGNFGASVQARQFRRFVTGTKRIAVLSQAGGAGASTIAENLAYELAARLSVQDAAVLAGPAALPPPHISTCATSPT